MKKEVPSQLKIFAGIGIVAFIAGNLNAFVFDHGLFGLCGSVVGAWLAYDNIQKIRAYKEGSNC